MATLHSTHTTRVSPDEEAAQSGYVRDQFVAFHLRQSRRASVNQLLAATMVFALFYSKLPGPIPCLWFALIALMLAARFQWGRLVGEGPAAPRRIALILMLTGIAQGLPVLAFGRFDTVDRAVVSLILMAISTASVMTVGGYRGIYLCFSLPMLAPLALAWAVYPAAGYAAWVGPAMGVEVALYQVFLVVLGRDVFRLFDSSCRIRFAEHSLNKQLVTIFARGAGG